MKRNCTLVMPGPLFQKLMGHLFPGDFGEHGAVIAAGLATGGEGYRFLARELFIAREGIDYVASTRGYRALTPQFIHRCITYCRDNRLVYLAVHNHGGSDSVAFSRVDMASHERGYPALLDIAHGMPVGALVFAENAIEADIWFPDGRRSALERAIVLGARTRHLFHCRRRTSAVGNEQFYHRQVMLFGSEGQAELARTTVGIIGLGGVGSLVNEYLSRLGIGHLVLVDPDRISDSNFSRVVGANVDDLTSGTLKVDIGARVSRQANPAIRLDLMADDIAKSAVASRLIRCDYLVLAADSMRARLVFNALVHQYFIPGVQLGAKVNFEATTGRILAAFSVLRRVLPGEGCLWCNHLVDAAGLAKEWKSQAEREDQNYGVASPNPSVITLNAIAAAHAVNDFMFVALGLREPGSEHLLYERFDHLRNRHEYIQPRRDVDCPECSPTKGSRFGMGDMSRLPCSDQSVRESRSEQNIANARLSNRPIVLLRSLLRRLKLLTA
jgi:ThiF family protein